VIFVLIAAFVAAFRPAGVCLPSPRCVHREAIAAKDFFTVPTLTFGVLYCFFVIAHGRRRIVHFNATRHPTGAWVTQQLREAFPYDSAPAI
jgi:hypothetical protein